MTDLFEAETVTTTTLDLRRLQRRNRRMRRRAWALALSAVGLVLTALAGSVAWNFVQTAFEGDETVVADYEGLGQGTVQVIIEAGQNGTQIAQTLYANQVVASEEAFIAAWNAEPSSSSIQPGYYWVSREMKAEYALQMLLDPNNREVRSLTVPEGLRLESYYDRIANMLPEYTIEEVRAAAEDTDALGLPEQAGGNLEGWLYPSTYSFNPGVTPTDVLTEMVAETVDILEEYDVPEDQWNRVLTVASLVEKEALLDADRPMIAGAIENRVERDMRLEIDATVKYIAPDSQGAFVSQEEKQIDSPYNTYMYTGLPPGPIAGAGRASIEAALQPADHNYIFWVTVNFSTGETRYAETYNEHLQNVAVMNQWIEENS